MTIGVNQVGQQWNVEALPPFYSNGHTGESFSHHALELAQEFYDTFSNPEYNTDLDLATGLVYFDFPNDTDRTAVERRSESLQHYLNLCLGVSGKNAALAPVVMFHLGRIIDAKIAELTDQTMAVAASSLDTVALERPGA